MCLHFLLIFFPPLCCNTLCSLSHLIRYASLTVVFHIFLPLISYLVVSLPFLFHLFHFSLSPVFPLPYYLCSIFHFHICKVIQRYLIYIFKHFTKLTFFFIYIYFCQKTVKSCDLGNCLSTPTSLTAQVDGLQSLLFQSFFICSRF